MPTHTAEVLWSRDHQAFIDKRYSRKHLLRFDGGIEIIGSASPQVVPLPYSVAEAVDPEEAFIASLSSCHMLWFLSIAAEQGFLVDHYHDKAEGHLSKSATGKLMMSIVTLRPEVRFSGARQPSPTEHAALHALAHAECFIANSVKTEIRCEPRETVR